MNMHATWVAVAILRCIFSLGQNLAEERSVVALKPCVCDHFVGRVHFGDTDAS